MSNTPYGNWGDGTALSAAILQGCQGLIPHPNAEPLASPDRSLVNEHLQHPQPSSPIRKV